MKISSLPILLHALVGAFSFLCSGCGSSDLPGIEENDSAYDRGRAHLRQGNEEEALDEFLSVTRRIVQSPQSHIEVGRLLMKLDSRRDPVAAIYHYRRFLQLSPESKEAATVEQLIVTAEREIIRKLPGEPYVEHLEALGLREENNRLKRELSDMRVRLGLPLETTDTVQSPSASTPSASPAVPLVPAKPPEPSVPRTHVVQQGDSLYAISRKFYGDSAHIDLIFNANRDVLINKRSLKIGQKLRIPPRPAP
ncbi:MAG: LysM peptidoglycan-binding domain-containing protein [Opitutae bacterium]|nr:LysM peptidoglycan-binding domain-containing protein [Opitutae bacterium]MBT6849685.1 LysM peptidoglycan-binding domain-containing protein [Opitutae bacterium]MBT7741085.1 LysM peptidoglycan-binding domain-containing protein [Opitutae bacterium]